jgi:Rrf2 family protein
MLYSKSAEYAIQAMIYLAENKSDKPIMIREIATAYGIPSQFLSKIMQILVKQRLIKATRGRKGGINLAKPAREIYLNQIVYAIDGIPPEQEQCVIGLDLCSDDTPCPLHEQWKPIRHQLRHMLELESLNGLAKRVMDKRNKMNI